VADSLQNHDSISGAILPLSPLASQMKVDLLINGELGRIAILHEEPLAGTVQWLEYDEDQRQLLLVYEDGQVQELGMRLPPIGREQILRAGEARVIFMKNDFERPYVTVPVIVREAVFH
jgi:hypothetical protein